MRSLSYRLALRVDPKDPRAQAGYVRAAAGVAQAQYARGDFDDALATIRDGLQVDPESVRLAAIERTIDEARLKREIVISNYPSYREAGTARAVARTAARRDQQAAAAQPQTLQLHLRRCRSDCRH